MVLSLLESMLTVLILTFFCHSPSHIRSCRSFPVSSALPLVILFLIYSVKLQLFLLNNILSLWLSFLVPHTCYHNTFLWGTFSDMKSFLTPVVWKFLQFSTWNPTPSESIFITLILSLTVHIPIQNCLGTVLSWLNYKLIRTGRLFGYVLYKIPHVSNIWFGFHPHFPITIWLAVPALSDLLITVIATIQSYQNKSTFL